MTSQTARPYHTVEQAAARLTELKGTLHETSDVLRLVTEGQLELSWLLHDVPARHVYPVTRLHGGFTGFGPFTELKGAETYEYGERINLFGYARMPATRNEQIPAWAIAMAVGKSPAQVSGDGVILEIGDGSLYQAVTDWGAKYDVVPRVDAVPMQEIVIQERDIQNYATADAFQSAEAADVPPAAQQRTKSECTTGEIARVFADIRFTHEEWENILLDPGAWLRSCKVKPGKSGAKPVQATWNPVAIASALAMSSKLKGNTKDVRTANLAKLTQRFRSEAPLKPFQAEWLEIVELMTD